MLCSSRPTGDRLIFCNDDVDLDTLYLPRASATYLLFVFVAGSQFWPRVSSVWFSIPGELALGGYPSALAWVLVTELLEAAICWGEGMLGGA